MSEDEGFTFLVVEVDEAPVPDDGFGTGATELDRHVKPPWARATREVTLTPDQIGAFWKEKVVGLTNTLADAQRSQPTRGFEVDEISFSLGVGAKGGVLFVAEASLQATISVKLKRLPAPPASTT